MCFGGAFGLGCLERRCLFSRCREDLYTSGSTHRYPSLYLLVECIDFPFLGVVIVYTNKFIHMFWQQFSTYLVCCSKFHVNANRPQQVRMKAWGVTVALRAEFSAFHSALRGNLQAEALDTGGKPSTWFPPGDSPSPVNKGLFNMFNFENH